MTMIWNGTEGVIREVEMIRFKWKCKSFSSGVTLDAMQRIVASYSENFTVKNTKNWPKQCRWFRCVVAALEALNDIA